MTKLANEAARMYKVKHTQEHEDADAFEACMGFLMTAALATDQQVKPQTDHQLMTGTPAADQ